MIKRNNKKGFTIVELVIVIAVIAILAAVLIPTFAGIVKKANESADIQAVREMNMFLAASDIADGVDSILDVYDVFDESGFTVEDYSPLYKGRTFFYDAQYKQILYVDAETGKVVFPEEHEGETKGTHNWFTLSMEIETIAVEADTTVAGTQKYSVASAGQYAYVVETLNKGFPSNTNVVIELTADVDMMGATVAIANVPANSSFTLNGNNKTLKNITANTFTTTGDRAEDANRKYIAAGLIGEAEGDVSITNLTLENVNVKDSDAGNVALVVGYLANKAHTISNITIKNSTVIGHRSVGAIVGMLYDDTAFADITLENVSVQTVAGRSGLLFGFATMSGCNFTLTNLKTTNSKLSIYECAQNTGEGCSIVDYTPEATYGTNATKKITSYSIETDGSKAYRTYGFNENAICCYYNPNSITIDGVTKPVDNANCEYTYCYFKLAE